MPYRHPLGLLLVALVAFPSFLHARPVEAPREGIRYVDLLPNPGLRGGVSGVFGAAQQGTTYFGGTTWDPVDARWEALQDSCWTFDTGVGSDFNNFSPDVNPFKDPALHTHMEGWVGIDNSYGGDNTNFRRLTDSDPLWSVSGSNICVGTAGGLGGSASLWAGITESESLPICYTGGQGYGTGWDVSVQRAFTYSGTGTIQLGYDLNVHSEPSFDFAYLEVDSSGVGDQFERVRSYTGQVSSTEAVTLTPGVELPSQAGPILLRFTFQSDGAYDDQDGLYVTVCGGMAVDNITVSGGATHSCDFETDDCGWLLAPGKPGAGGEWSDILHINSLPPPLTDCGCSLQDSILVFEDLTIGGHGLYQDNYAASPWIDLAAAGFAGVPGKLIETDVYADFPLLNYIFSQFLVQWYPQTCPTTGAIRTSPWTSTGFAYHIGQGTPTCTTPGEPGVRVDFSQIVDPGAERMRIGIGVISWCRFFANCTGITNSTPWYDNTKLGVYGLPDAPFISSSDANLPMDSFPKNGTLRLDAPGRVDADTIYGSWSPDPFTSLGDTLVVEGGLPGSGSNAGAEVHVQFAVRPGPDIDTGTFQSWLLGHTSEGPAHGQNWYSARMDTAMNGSSRITGKWATLYNESDPNFAGSDTDVDPTDIDPLGNLTRKANDIFPDDLFTMGTRINLFYKTRYVDSGGAPTTGVWFTFPDTTGGTFLEMEVLPSSAGADSTWNCVLYVNHADGYGSREVIEPALANVMPGLSANAEGTPWDRFDVRNSGTSGAASLGRPPATEYGATLSQIYAYHTILWDSAHLTNATLTQRDAEVLRPWLILDGFNLGNNRLYLTGDGMAQSITSRAGSAPDAILLLEQEMGVSFTCGTVRDPACNGVAVSDEACVQVDPVSGAAVGNNGSVALAGNGCPKHRDYDMITPHPSAGLAQGDERYQTLGAGPVDFASVTNVLPTSNGLTVMDGGSVAHRRDRPGCSGTTAVEDRLFRVLTWFGYLDSAQACEEIYTCTDCGPWEFSEIPDVLVGTPDGSYLNTVRIQGSLGPVVGALVEIEFTPLADPLIVWGPGQAHPSITGNTDANGYWSFGIAGGGCVDPARLGDVVINVYADGILMAQPGFSSVDLVNHAGALPTDPAYVPDACIQVGASDAAFFAAGYGLPEFCTDFDDDDVTGPADSVLFNTWMSTLCGTTPAGFDVPAVNRLAQNAPNPVANRTAIAFDLAEASRVKLSVFDVTGRLVRTLVDAEVPAGFHEAAWDARDERGRTVTPGFYFYRLESPDFVQTRKMVVLR